MYEYAYDVLDQYWRRTAGEVRASTVDGGNLMAPERVEGDSESSYAGAVQFGRA